MISLDRRVALVCEAINALDGRLLKLTETLNNIGKKELINFRISDPVRILETSKWKVSWSATLRTPGGCYMFIDSLEACMTITGTTVRLAIDIAGHRVLRAGTIYMCFSDDKLSMSFRGTGDENVLNKEELENRLLEAML